MKLPNFKNTIAFREIISYFRLSSEEGGKIRILRDWKVLLAVFLVFWVIIGTISALVFTKQQEGTAGENESDSGEIVKINKILLNRAIDDIQNRKENFEKNLTAPEIKDPSIIP